MTQVKRRPLAAHNQIERYYQKWGWIYPLLWGETIHWGLFKTGLEPLSIATKQWTERTAQLLHPTAGQKVLEIGCGPAVTSHHLIEKYNVSVDAIDVSEVQLARAKVTNPDFLRDARLHLIKGDIARTTLQPHTYNGAVSEAVFFHLKEKQKGFENIRKALQPGARFVFDDLILKSPINKCDLAVAFGRFGMLKFVSQSFYSRMLRRAGFRIIEIVSATDDVARTYQRLLDNLENQHNKRNSPFSKQKFLNLRNSFRTIIQLIWDGKLSAKVFVAIAV